MSEYQYYEFRAMDHPLTNEQKEKIDSLSSRAHVTSHKASFVYNYGDFRGDEKQLITDYFDMMLYVASWGSRRLMFRLPSTLVDGKQLAPFCISEEIDHWSSKDKKNIILDLNFADEEQADWVEGEGWLDELVDLREELIQGDFRVLYLAWLKAATKALAYGEIDEDTLEPPVPPGLSQLSKAQQAYVSYIEIDEVMVAAAAQQSEGLQSRKIKPEEWIHKLPEEQKYEFLYRLSIGEKNLSTLLNRRLHELAIQEKPCQEKEPTKPRTISALIKLMDEWHQQKEEEEKKKAEMARRRKLELLATRKDETWQEIYKLIEEKKSSAYDKAMELLKNLHDLAQYQAEWQQFNEHIQNIKSTYSSRSALLRRMKSVGLMD